MELELTEDQEIFRDTTRRFLSESAPLPTVRDLYGSADGFDRAWWQQAAELGWTSLFVPAALDGGSLSGRPTADAVIVAEEMGRMVSPGPFLPVNVVASALAAGGSDRLQAEVLPGVLTGETIASWAHAEPGGRWDPDRMETTALVEGGEVVLRGQKAYVEAAACADHFLVTARSGDGLTQVLVPAGTAGVEVVPGRSVDMTRRFGRLGLDDVRLAESAIVGTPGEADEDIARQWWLALALQCAESVGVADRTLEFTIEYGLDRIAFGRPIMSFQALKHRIADMTVWLEGSKAVADALATSVDGPDAGGADGRLGSVAKAYVGEKALDIVDDCVQITGGIGVTWEHDIHLYNRRAAVNRAMFGTPEEHKARLFELLADEGDRG